MDLIKESVNALSRECYKTAENSGFHKEANPLPQSLMLIVSEAAEALEAYRDNVWDYTEITVIADHTQRRTDKPIGVGSELADVLIRVLDTGREHFGDRFGEIVAMKMAYNKTREPGHGRVRL